ncbi:MAG: DNA-binding transcriptional regulator Fis [Proteobacteria bacterium]|nr:DNA-binding transcriptional regulator Fis [Pseudomonadota bacterium]
MSSMSDQNFQPATSDAEQPEENQQQEISQLSHAVKHSIRRYLFELEGTQPNNMYELVLRQVEQPLFEAILEHTKGNQSRAAELLGLNRGTLRKKLRSYNLHK